MILDFLILEDLLIHMTRVTLNVCANNLLIRMDNLMGLLNPNGEVYTLEIHDNYGCFNILIMSSTNLEIVASNWIDPLVSLQ